MVQQQSPEAEYRQYNWAFCGLDCYGCDLDIVERLQIQIFECLTYSTCFNHQHRQCI